MSSMIKTFENLIQRIRKHNWLILKLIKITTEEAIESYATGRMLDVGCGIKPYQRIAKGFVDKHIGLDHPNTLHGENSIDVFGLADHLPFSDESFDTVLSTCVLEHLEEPASAIAEINRVLVGGGYCILSTNFFWHIHEPPRDFYRYSKYGLQYLFEKYGFTIIDIKAVCGFWVTFGQEMCYYLRSFRKNSILRILIDAFSFIIQVFSYALDKIYRDEDFTAVYVVVARKL